MIVDKIENMTLYTQIPDYVVDFIKLHSADSSTGKYLLNSNEYANIEEYNTKDISSAKFEAHRKYIDIQILLKGSEKIYIAPAKDLNLPLNYDDNKDIMFFEDNVDNNDYVSLDSTNFALIYPHEAHAPQITKTNESSLVKKMVIKLLV